MRLILKPAMMLFMYFLDRKLGFAVLMHVRIFTNVYLWVAEKLLPPKKAEKLFVRDYFLCLFFPETKHIGVMLLGHNIEDQSLTSHTLHYRSSRV